MVESAEGHFFPGVRVENLAFPLTITAIQNAIYCCLSEGELPKVLYSNAGTNQLTSFWYEEYDLRVGSSFRSISGASFKEVLLTDIKIKETLQQLFKHAVVGNSQFPVACLLETDRGFIGGVNVENDEWTTGLCAERVAIGKAFSYGITEFKALHISTQKGEYCSPCGACRQVIAEHLPQKQVYLYHPDGTQSVHFSNDLLPYSFQSASLKKHNDD